MNMKQIHAYAIEKLYIFFGMRYYISVFEGAWSRTLCYLNGSNFGYFWMTVLFCEINTA